MAELTYDPVTPPPGLWRNGTKYQAKGLWYEANLVRFFSGTIQPVGGWQAATLDGGATFYFSLPKPPTSTETKG